MQVFLHDTLAYLLGSAFNLMESRLSREFEPLGITPKQYKVLTALASTKEQEMNQQAVGNLIGINRNTMVHLVDQLERQKFVDRRTNPKNRREYILHLTRRGGEVAVEADRLVQSLEKKLFSSWEPSQRNNFLEYCTRLIAAVKDDCNPPSSTH